MSASIVGQRLSAYYQAAVFGTAMGSFCFFAMWGMERFTMSNLGAFFGFLDLVGFPGMIVSLFFALCQIVGNVHDPSIYVAAIANGIFYGLIFFRIRKLRRSRSSQ